MRRIPWVILLMVPIMTMIRLSQDRLGLGGALATGWPLFLSLLWLFRKHHHKSNNLNP